MKKGISLIVLIITIIVMIIIAGAVIMTLSNTDIFDKASNAKDEYNEAAVLEELNYIVTSNMLSNSTSSNGTKVNINAGTRMVNIIEDLKKQYGTENISFNVIDVNNSYERSNDDLINYWYGAEATRRLIESIIEYIKKIPDSGLSTEQVFQYLDNKEDEYRLELKAKRSTSDIIIDFSDNNLFAGFMEGDPSVAVTFKETMDRITEELIIVEPIVNVNNNTLNYKIEYGGKICEFSPIEVSPFIVNSYGVITGYRGTPPKNLVIPSTVDGIPVLAIANRAFRGIELDENGNPIGIVADEETGIPDFEASNFNVTTNENIETIVFPEGLKYIGYQSFIGLRKLTQITLPSSIEIIGADVLLENGILSTNENRTEGMSFAICDSLATITLPANIEVKAGDFMACSALNNVTVGNNAILGPQVFALCSSLNTVNLGTGVTSKEDTFMMTPYAGE